MLSSCWIRAGAGQDAQHGALQVQLSPEGNPGQIPLPKNPGLPTPRGTGLQQGGDSPGKCHLQPNLQRSKV